MSDGKYGETFKRTNQFQCSVEAGAGKCYFKKDSSSARQACGSATSGWMEDCSRCKEGFKLTFKPLSHSFITLLMFTIPCLSPYWLVGFCVASLVLFLPHYLFLFAHPHPRLRLPASLHHYPALHMLCPNRYQQISICIHKWRPFSILQFPTKNGFTKLILRS